MKFFIESLVFLSEVLSFLFIGMLIGLWWMPEISHGNMLVSLAVATLGLMLEVNYFNRHVYKVSLIRFYILTLLGICAISGYLYGVFFKLI